MPNKFDTSEVFDVAYEFIDESVSEYVRNPTKNIPARKPGFSTGMTVPPSRSDGDSCGTVHDYDWNEYGTTVIDNKCWTTSNLKTSHFMDGTGIRLKTGAGEWYSDPPWGHRCVYDNNPVGGEIWNIHGYLYDGDVIAMSEGMVYGCPDTYEYINGWGCTWEGPSTPKNICPEGYRIPSDNDWEELTSYIDPESLPWIFWRVGADSSEIAGGPLKDTTYWNSPNTGATDEYGFAAMGSGIRTGYVGAEFMYFMDATVMWSSTQIRGYSEHHDEDDGEWTFPCPEGCPNHLDQWPEGAEDSIMCPGVGGYEGDTNCSEGDFAPGEINWLCWWYYEQTGDFWLLDATDWYGDHCWWFWDDFLRGIAYDHSRFFWTRYLTHSWAGFTRTMHHESYGASIRCVTDKPILQYISPTGSINEDQTTYMTLTSTGYIDGGVTYTASSTDPGLIAVSIDGDVLTATTGPDRFGVATLTITVTNTNGRTDSAQMVVTVQPVSDDPGCETEFIAYEDEPTALVFNTNTCSPAWGESFTFVSYTQPNVPESTLTGTLEENGGMLFYTPAENYSGADTFTYQVSTTPPEMTHNINAVINVIPVSDGITCQTVSIDIPEDYDPLNTDWAGGAYHIHPNCTTADPSEAIERWDIVGVGPSYGHLDYYTYQEDTPYADVVFGDVVEDPNVPDNWAFCGAPFHYCGTWDLNTLIELAHDDGIAEIDINVGQNNYWAVRFQGKGLVKQIHHWQVGNGGAFYFKIWEDDNGLPGPEIFSSIQTGMDDGWNIGYVEEPIYIDNQTFWVGIREFSSTRNFGMDTDSNSGNTYIRIGSDGDWVTGDIGNLLLRVLLDNERLGWFWTPHVDYIPDANYSGPDGFIYTATTVGGVVSNEANVQITVYPVADIPTINLPGTITFGEDQTLDVSFGPFVADVEDSDEELTLTVDDPEHIDVVINGLFVTFSTKVEDWHGTEELTFNIIDTDGGTASATVDIVVIGNEPDIYEVIAYSHDSAGTIYDAQNSWHDEAIENDFAGPGGIGLEIPENGSGYVNMRAKGEWADDDPDIFWTITASDNFSVAGFQSGYDELGIDGFFELIPKKNFNTFEFTPPPWSNYLALFPSANDGTLYEFDGTYVSALQLETGKGYWLNFPANITVDFTCPEQGPKDIPISLSAGWNLIGGLGDSTPLYVADIPDPDNIIVPGTLYGFEGTYQNSSYIHPGKGYWINASADGTIVLSDVEFGDTISENYAQGWNLVSNPCDSSSTLYQEPNKELITVTASIGDYTDTINFYVSVPYVSSAPEASYLGVYARGEELGNIWEPILFHLPGIDTQTYSDWLSNPVSGCGDTSLPYGLQTPTTVYDLCIYDPDPYENNPWWDEEQVMLTPALFTYMAIQVTGIDPVSAAKHAEHCGSLAPLYYRDAQGVNDDINPNGTRIYPSRPDLDHIPYFDQTVSDPNCTAAQCFSGLNCTDYTNIGLCPPPCEWNPPAGSNGGLECAGGNDWDYQCVMADGAEAGDLCGPANAYYCIPEYLNGEHCEGIDCSNCTGGGLGLWFSCDDAWSGSSGYESFEFRFYYKVVECMNWGGDLAGWGQPFCAESKVDENGNYISTWTCDSDEDNLDCSEDHVVSLIVHDVNAVVSDFDFEFPEGRFVAAQFYDTSIPGEGAAIMVEWDWDFGDGTTSCCNLPNPSHEYLTPGQYNVSLTATDSMGNVDTRVRQVIV